MIFGHNKQRENSNVDTAKDKEACGEDFATTAELFREHFNIDGKRKMGIVSYLKLGTYVFAIDLFNLIFLFFLNTVSVVGRQTQLICNSDIHLSTYK